MKLLLSRISVGSLHVVYREQLRCRPTTQRHRQYLGTVEHLVFVIDDPPRRISKGTVANVSYPLSRGSQELQQWRMAEKKH
jgi:hypothetical protein